MNKLLAEKLAYTEEEVVEEEEDDEEDEEYDEDEKVEDEKEENYDNIDDACLWHDPFLDWHNLEIEIPYERGVMVQVPMGVFGVGDEESMSDIPLPEGVGSIPRNVVSVQSSDASFPDGFDLEVNQIFETKDEL